MNTERILAIGHTKTETFVNIARQASRARKKRPGRKTLKHWTQRGYRPTPASVARLVRWMDGQGDRLIFKRIDFTAEKKVFTFSVNAKK